MEGDHDYSSSLSPLPLSLEGRGVQDQQSSHPHLRRGISRLLLVAALVLYCCACIVGISWGLPTSRFDAYLFPAGDVWPGAKIHQLVKADTKFAATLGADVDPDAIVREGRQPVLLNSTEADVAKIYLRYRLYTYQPDEMITMMALAGMKPGELKLDPRLYQYGGLFIYPVGALLKLCDLIGLIDVRGDVGYYLDHPDEFGKFYIVARAYAAAWGLIGILVIFAIARRLGTDPPQPPFTTVDLRLSKGGDTSATAGLLAAAFFAVMPVVVCMSHEGKPHLPGAVLMLAAVYLGMRAVQDEQRNRGSGLGGRNRAPARDDQVEVRHSTKWFWLMSFCCGAALGMVLSSAPIFVLIPLVAWMSGSSKERTSGGLSRRVVGGVASGLAVYLLTNPYILINLFRNREVLRSNFGNSLAMYEVSRLAEGFARVLELTVEGATLPVLVFGMLALLIAVLRRNRTAFVLAVPAMVFFLQFVLIGAGKPAEYGRFGIFPNAALVIGTACLLASAWRHRRSLLRAAAIAAVVLWVAIHGAAYLRNFWLDTTDNGSRMVAAKFLAAELVKPETRSTVTLYAEPAPYSCPPMNFAGTNLMLLSEAKRLKFADVDGLQVFVDAVDELPAGAPRLPDAGPAWLSWLPSETPISWANKPFIVEFVASQ